MKTDELEIIRRYSRRYGFNIRSTDTGPDDRATPHCLAACIQEAASLDAISLGFGADRLDDKGIVWILIRHSLRYTGRPCWRDDIVIDTWTNGVSGISALRDFYISSPDGSLIAKAATSWIIADRNTKRPVRTSVLDSPDMEVFRYHSLGAEAVRIRPPELSQGSLPVLEQRVCASDIDRNGHVNNTRYIAWCEDALDASGEDACSIAGFDINYNTEALKGETIELYCMKKENEKTFYVIGKHKNDSRTSFCAVIYLSN